MLRTTKANYTSFRHSIPWSLIPKTFRDAIIFASRLGISYLWIDSLCIVQDDSADWDREGATMAEVFANGLVTIAATHASSSEVGLFTTQQQYSPSLQVARANIGNRIYPIFARPTWSHATHAADEHPLSQRAWVFQELLLSPRSIHFIGVEIVWEFKETTCCECGKEKTAQEAMHWHRRLLQTTHRTIFEEWRDLVHSYSSKKLTYESDRLAALSGLATLWSHRSVGAYLTGLWSDDLLEDLVWISQSPAKRTWPILYEAPSWSWVSITVSIGSKASIICHLPLDFDRWYATVISASCTPRGLNPFGAVKSGHLLLRGRCVDAMISYGTPVFYTAMYDSPLSAYVSVGAVKYVFMADVALWEAGPDFMPAGTVVKMLLMQAGQIPRNLSDDQVHLPTWRFLVLRSSLAERGSYERIGLLHIDVDEIYWAFVSKRVLEPERQKSTTQDHRQEVKSIERSWLDRVDRKSGRLEDICEDIDRPLFRQLDRTAPQDYRIV